MRFSDGSSCPGRSPLFEADRRLIMHIAQPILGGHVLIGTDAPKSMGFIVTQGTNLYLNPEPDARVGGLPLRCPRRRRQKGATNAGNVLGRLRWVPGRPLWGALDVQLHREIAAVISGPPKWEAVELVCQTDLWVKADRLED